MHTLEVSSFTYKEISWASFSRALISIAEFYLASAARILRELGLEDMASLKADSLGCSKLQGLAGYSYDGSYRARPMKIVAATKYSAGPKEGTSSKQAMETLTKRAPVTADHPVSYTDIPLENLRM